MYPVLIRLGWFNVYSFGFMLAMSFLIGIYISSSRGKKFGVDPQHILDLSVYVIVSGVVGSRLLYVAFHLEEYDNFVDVFALWQGGATLYGGFLLAIFAGFVFSQKRKIGFFLLGDIISPALALGIMLTRVGCFLSGCCFGKETTHTWGVAFPSDSPAGVYAAELAAEHGVNAVLLHPAQLYASFFALVTLILLLVLQKRLTKQGATFGVFLVCYGIFRFSLDFFRFYEANMRVLYDLTLNQIVSAVLLIIGMYLLLRKTEGKTVPVDKSSK
ncbi:MAG: prolipoprotein diacylglyceryl transferase [Candidatus Latescibacterota bacterium]|nr:MAG: prolipoprotein diacylglyceryl transferase [Candidatus Latescibacterota bacterium]